MTAKTKTKTTKTAERKLTPKQARFVEEYLLDLNATQACIRAGYTQKNAASVGSQLLQKTQVQSAISRAKEKRSKESGIDAKWVLENAVDLYSKSSESYSYPINEKGESVTRFVDSACAAKCLDMIAKHVGFYEADNKRLLDGGLKIVWGNGKDKDKDAGTDD